MPASASTSMGATSQSCVCSRGAELVQQPASLVAGQATASGGTTTAAEFPGVQDDKTCGAV